MNDARDRTFLDMKQWNPHIGKMYYELNPQDKNQFRTYYIRWEAFANAMRSYPSNYITGTPPDGMKAITTSPKCLHLMGRGGTCPPEKCLYTLCINVQSGGFKKTY